MEGNKLISGILVLVVAGIVLSVSGTILKSIQDDQNTLGAETVNSTIDLGTITANISNGSISVRRDGILFIDDFTNWTAVDEIVDNVTSYFWVNNDTGVVTLYTAEINNTRWNLTYRYTANLYSEAYNASKGTLTGIDTTAQNLSLAGLVLSAMFVLALLIGGFYYAFGSGRF